METSFISSDIHGGLTKKLKTIDVYVPTSYYNSNDCVMNDSGSSVHLTSRRWEYHIYGNMDEANESIGTRQTLGEVILYSDNDIKECTMSSPSLGGESTGTSTTVSESTALPDIAVTQSCEIANERNEPTAAHIGHTAGSGLLFEVPLMDERQLIRERKQANRESARRSRLKKQAEIDALMIKYESRSRKNVALKSEINQLKEVSEKARLENVALKEKLRNVQLIQFGRKVSTIQVDLDEKQLKRERRKQTNRESARRSWLRKQAEMDAVAMTFESASRENMALKSEINQLTKATETIRLEIAALKEKLKDAHSSQFDPDNTTKFSNSYKKLNSEAKVHKMLEPKSSTDTVVAR